MKESTTVRINANSSLIIHLPEQQFLSAGVEDRTILQQRTSPPKHRVMTILFLFLQELPSTMSTGKNNDGGNTHTRDIQELGSNLCTCRAKNQGDRYLRITEVIANYVRREHGKAMRQLVLGTEDPDPPQELEELQPVKFHLP